MADFYPFHAAIRGEGPREEGFLGGQGEEGWDRYLGPESRELDRPDPSGLTPLHLAILHGRRDLALKLLSRGASRTVGDATGFQALHHAASRGDVELITKLLRMGVDPQATSHSGFTPLAVAIGNGHTQAVSILLTHIRKDQDRSSIYGTDLMAGRSHVDKFSPWLCQVGDEILDGLVVASQRGYTGIVTTLLEHGANPNRSSRADPQPAASYDDPDAMTSYTDVTALHYACREGHVATAEALIGQHANVNAMTSAGLTPLLLACQRGHVTTVDLLLRHHALVTMDTEQSASCPMSAAIRLGNYDIISALLEHGADWSACDDRGNTALHIACDQGRTSDVTVLLGRHFRSSGGSTGSENEARAAVINAQNQEGQSALHVATRRGHSALVLVLVNHGADTNLGDRHGWTPLHLSTEQERLVIIKTLLGHGADPARENAAGHTPLDLARMSSDRPKVDILLDHTDRRAHTGNTSQQHEDRDKGTPDGEEGQVERLRLLRMPERIQQRRGSHDSSIQRSLVMAGQTGSAVVTASASRNRNSTPIEVSFV